MDNEYLKRLRGYRAAQVHGSRAYNYNVNYPVDNSFRKIEFDKTLGQYLVTIARSLAPYDTGNLASNIYLPINNINHIQIKYPLQYIHYLYFLEFGTRYSNQNVGFIRDRTREAITDEAINYISNRNYLDKSYSASEEFYKITQDRGVGTGGLQGSKYRVGYSRTHVGETREDRSNLSQNFYNEYIDNMT